MREGGKTTHESETERRDAERIRRQRESEEDEWRGFFEYLEWVWIH